MATVIQKVQITISIERDIDTIYWFYKLYPPTGPNVPTKASLVKPATKGGVPTDSTSSTYPWFATEPAYTNGDTKSLYIVSLTYFTDGTSEFSEVSVSSSYEASKQAYNEAQNAKTMATNYIQTINNGVWVTPSTMKPNPDGTPALGTRGVRITDQIDIFRGTNSVASFGESARVGLETDRHIDLSTNGFDVAIDEDSYIVEFRYGSTQGESSIDTTPYYIIGRRNTPITYSLATKYGSPKNTLIVYNGIQYISNTAIAEGEEWTPSHWDVANGAYSLVEGRDCFAKGPYSHAEGFDTVTVGLAAHAEGEGTIASGHYSHAEGLDTQATDFYAHAEGNSTKASSYGAHAQNIGTEARARAQTVIGTYNYPNGEALFPVHPNGNRLYGTYAFIIGNGTNSSNVSNALTVDWKGNVDIASGAKYKINGASLAPSDLGVLDYIIEKGNNGDWYYEKWSSGKIEAWGGPISSGTLSISAQGSLYRATNVSISIPSGIFTSTPTYTQVYTEYTSAVFVSASGNATSATNINCQIWKATNNTTAVNLRFHCVYFPSDY